MVNDPSADVKKTETILTAYESLKITKAGKSVKTKLTEINSLLLVLLLPQLETPNELQILLLLTPKGKSLLRRV
jgi:hypothetical protein